jgi:hypothetical protein
MIGIAGLPPLLADLGFGILGDNPALRREALPAVGSVL